MSALIAAGAGSQVGRFRSMKYVVVRPEPTGFWLDPRGYLAELASLSAVLPPGACAIALSPGHYDFPSPRCVKDLRLSSVEHDTNADHLVMKFPGHPSKHDQDLTLTYWGVRSMSPDAGAAEVGRHASLLLDELLPTSVGFDHEFAFAEGGTIRVSAEDLSAAWG